MMSRVFTTACALVCAAAVLAPLPARADVSEARAISAGLIEPTTAELQRALQQMKDDRQVAQANPVGAPQAPIRKPSLPQGFTYNVDASIAYPTNNPGYNANDPGGVDVGFGYAFSRTNRLQAGYYEIQQVPLGFSNKSVPFYIQGFTGPGTALAQLYQNTGVVDVTTKDQILTLVDQNLFVIGHGATSIPIVISPTYLAHTAKIAGGSDDRGPIMYNGFPQYGIKQRTEQEWILPVTLPFLATPRMFGTATAAAQWLNHPNGLNQTNKAQMFLLGYLEYRASRSTTFFVQPSRLIQYNPPDVYPQHVPTLIYGLSHHFTPQTFVQMTVLEGGPSNDRDLGITSLTCQRLPCNASNTYPTLAGLKASEVQIQFGLGSPTVIPL